MAVKHHKFVWKNVHRHRSSTAITIAIQIHSAKYVVNSFVKWMYKWTQFEAVMTLEIVSIDRIVHRGIYQAVHVCKFNSK